MACDAATLASDSKCLAAGMSDHQLLAAIAYLLAVQAGVATDPQTLVTASRCLHAALGRTQLEAVIAYLQCQINGG